jgi:hypothetical protein
LRQLRSFAGGSRVTITGLNAYNSTASSVGAFSAAGNPALLKKTIDYVKPEKVKAFELGYRSFITGIIIFMTYWNLNVLHLIYHKILQVEPLPEIQGFNRVHASTEILEFSLYNTKVEINHLVWSRV